MTPGNRQAIIEHAEREYPRECCGLLVNHLGQEKYIPCRNQAIGDDDFQLHPEDYVAAEKIGDVLAVVHSHPNASAAPSQADRVACEATGLPWHIVSYPNIHWSSIRPSGYRAPLIGRQWSHGILDCYAIIRDWYAEERAITLPDFQRDFEWWYKGQNLYVENFAKAGFMVVDDEWRRGDVILMQVLANVTNHAAIYLGDDVMLHHLFNRLSSRDTYGGYWKKHTTHHLRYRGQA